MESIDLNIKKLRTANDLVLNPVNLGVNNHEDPSVVSSANQSANAQTESIRAGIARKVIFSQLEKLTRGTLIVREAGKTHKFGGTHSNPQGKVVSIDILDSRTYMRVLMAGTIGVAEGYIAGEWRVSSLIDLIQLFLQNEDSTQNMDTPIAKCVKQLASVAGRFKINGINKSKKYIASHYDLNNAFFSLFLDPKMMYSSALYDSSKTSLEAASEAKLDRICEQLQLRPTDHLLEIGTGWGGLAIHAATNYGCKVTTTTISEEQYVYAKKEVERLALEDRVTVLKQDYRLLTGTYDKLVSVEMIEAIGFRNFKNYFKTCSNLVKQGGRIMLQAITTQDQRFERDKSRPDFIRKYIFPGGCLPSINVILSNTAKHTDLAMINLHDMTHDYALTLAEWHQRFNEKIDEVKALGFDDHFIRLWKFYLAYCEGGFRERVIQTSQILFVKPGC